MKPAPCFWTIFALMAASILVPFAICAGLVKSGWRALTN